MTGLSIYADRRRLPISESERIGMLLGLSSIDPIDDIELAERVSRGLGVGSVDELICYLGRSTVVGPIISSTTLHRAVPCCRWLAS